MEIVMTKILEIYKCNACGNIVEVIHAGTAPLICCGEPMVMLTENTTDASKEKHVPIVSKTTTGFKVMVGSVPHPMEETHYIEWIELIADGMAYRRFLKPGVKPEAEFIVAATVVSAREHCNIHGLWRA